MRPSELMQLTKDVRMLDTFEIDGLHPSFQRIIDDQYPIIVAEWRHLWRGGYYVDFKEYLLHKIDEIVMQEAIDTLRRKEMYPWDGWVE